MESLYHRTNAQLQEVHFAMGRLEGSSNESNAQAVTTEIQQKMRVIDDACQKLEVMISKEPVAKRQNWKYKLDQLNFDCKNVHRNMGSVFARLTNKWRSVAEREELLTQRFRANEPTALTIEDSELLINDGLHRSNRNVDGLIDQGQSVLDSLRLQHSMLKGVKGKIVDVGKMLGLSGTTLRMIEKRVDEDWIIFLVGCICVCIFMYTFYRFWHG
ncbi:hypothetical protein QR680_017002 [Steinernema hermaphroditum]|uniref:Golgi SNAP receptor complex member 2 n=1 Tax=Steinernema hermaphroditum TaxID=289476 RepID=A0AA39HE47_9BILA|nr:hypothetical protein QR680_017002 [Steinernema hermaphroditum]